VQGITSMTPIKTSPQTADAADQAVMTNPPVPIAGKLTSDATKAAMPAFLAAGTGFSMGMPTDAVLIKGTTAVMEATTSTEVIAGVASNYLYITSCSFSNTDASVSTMMQLKDGEAGTVIWAGYVPFESGREVQFPIPLKVTTVSTGLWVLNATTSAMTYCSCSGFRSTISF